MRQSFYDIAPNNLAAVLTLAAIALGLQALPAQSAAPAPGQSLPAVTVDAPDRARAARTVRRSGSAVPSRTIARRGTPAPAPAAPTAGAVARERANGPVNGYLASRSGTGTKTDTTLLETPQAISIVTRDQIQAQGAQTLMDALHYTPAVSLEAFNTSAFFDSVKIRGFTAPVFLDGLRVPTDGALFAVPRFEPYGLERIEVLKGPSSGLYGQSDPGGLLNLVSKRPRATPHYEVEGTFGSYDRLQGAFDIGGPVGSNGEVSYRIVGLARQSDTQTNFVEDNKLYFAPSLTWRPSVDTSFTVLSHYQKIDNKGYQQYVPGQGTLLANPFGRLSRSTYLGEPEQDRYNIEQSSVGYEFTHRFDNNLQFRQNLRYMEVSNNMVAMRGDTLVADRLFFRTPIHVASRASNFALDNQLQADFATGPLVHKVLAGFDFMNSRSSNQSRLAASPLLYSPIDIFNPVYGGPIAPLSALTSFIDINSKQQQAGIYLQDQVKLDRWTLSLTGRQDWSSIDNVSAGFVPPAGIYNRSDAASTGRVGLNYLFDFGLSPYANYSTSFVPNTGVSLQGNSFKPTTGEGEEIGLKYMAPGTNLMFTAALFEINQKDVLTLDPAAGGVFINAQTDAARVRGFELEARGNVTREFEIVAGYSKLNPEVTTSLVGNTGKYLPNVNLEQASFWGKYTWHDGGLAGFGIGAGVRHVGENFGDSANTIRIPSYTVFDATASFDLAYARPDLRGWKAQVNATNIANTYYVTSCQSTLAYCGLGTGRTVLGTLKYSWN